jgi:hypothetical protein
LVGGIEFSGEARLLSRVPTGWETRAFALLMLVLIATRLLLARRLAAKPNRLPTLLAAALAICVVSLTLLPPASSTMVFLSGILCFGLSKAALWPGLLALGAQSAPRHVRFILPALVSLGVLAPGLLALALG